MIVIPPSCYEHHICPCCGDRLIHQNRRGPHESSSAIGQFVHDKLHRRHTWIDIDGLGWKRSYRRLTLVEHKFIGQFLSDAQRELLPILARALASLDDIKSRVVCLTGNEPFDTATATLFLPDGTTQHRDLNRCQVEQLLTGEEVTGTKPVRA